MKKILFLAFFALPIFGMQKSESQGIPRYKTLFACMRLPAALDELIMKYLDSWKVESVEFPFARSVRAIIPLPSGNNYIIGSDGTLIAQTDKGKNLNLVIGDNELFTAGCLLDDKHCVVTNDSHISILRMDNDGFDHRCSARIPSPVKGLCAIKGGCIVALAEGGLQLWDAKNPDKILLKNSNSSISGSVLCSCDAGFLLWKSHDGLFAFTQQDVGKVSNPMAVVVDGKPTITALSQIANGTTIMACEDGSLCELTLAKGWDSYKTKKNCLSVGNGKVVALAALMNGGFVAAREASGDKLHPTIITHTNQARELELTIDIKAAQSSCSVM